MNYSATEAYHQKCDQFAKKEIRPNKVRRRWFRKFYVEYVSRGYFGHYTYVLHEDEIIGQVEHITGTLYGPFTLKQAETFAEDVRTTHLSFITG